MTEIDIDIGAIDYFRTKDLYDDPYPYFEEVRTRCPVTQEPFQLVFMS